MAVQKREDNKNGLNMRNYAEILRVRNWHPSASILPMRITEELTEILTDFKKKPQQ